MKKILKQVVCAIVVVFAPLYADEITSADEFRQRVEQTAMRMQDDMAVELKGKALRLLKKLRKDEVWPYIDHASSIQWRSSKEDRNVLEFSFEMADNSRILAAVRTPSLLASLSSEERSVLQKVKASLGRCIKPGMSQNDKILAVCREIFGIADLKRGYHHYGERSCASVFIDRKATPDAHARTLQLMLSMLDIPCHIVWGTCKPFKGNAMWNIVQFENGQWYHIDLYSDKCKPGDKFKYFGLADAEMKRDHHWSREGYEPTPKNSLGYSFRRVANRKVVESAKMEKSVAEPEEEEPEEEAEEESGEEEEENESSGRLKESLNKKWKALRTGE